MALQQVFFNIPTLSKVFVQNLCACELDGFMWMTG
jgi:hypothetical protein